MTAKVIPIAKTTPIRVLLIEDSPTHAEIVKSQLIESDENFQITHCWSWAEAYRELQRRQFDDVVLDLTLPDVRSANDQKEILDILDRFQLPVTILSGAVKDKNISKLLEQRNVPFLQKGNPSDANKLIDVLLAQQSDRARRSAQVSGELQRVAIKVSQLEILTNNLANDSEKFEVEIYGGTGGYGIKTQLETVRNRYEHLLSLLEDNRRNDEGFREEIKSEIASARHELKSELAALREQRTQFDLESHKAKLAMRGTVLGILATAVITAAIPYLTNAFKISATQATTPATIEATKKPQ